ncbi:MAG: hypothetical protein WA632_03600 [Gallionella sp.]
MQIKYELPGATVNASPLRKIVTAIVTLTVFGLMLMFSVVLFAIILIAGVVGWGFLWWKTRKLRSHLRDISSAQIVRDSEFHAGNVIEGEARRVDDVSRH